MNWGSCSNVQDLMGSRHLTNCYGLEAADPVVTMGLQAVSWVL